MGLLSARLLPSISGAQIQLAEEGQILQVNCSDRATLGQVRSMGLVALLRFAENADITVMQTRLLIEERYQVIDTIPVSSIRRTVMQIGTPVLKDAEAFALFQQAALSGQSLSLVDHYNHTGLMTTNHAQHCGTSEADWSGKDMSLWWEPHDLRQYMEAIDANGVVNGLEWKAFRMNVEREPIKTWGSIERVNFRGRTCRLVRIHEVISLA